MFENNNGIYIDNRTGQFLVELSNLTDEIDFFQFKMKFGISRRMADYRIDDKKINIIGITRGKYKFLPYLKAFFIGNKKISNADFLYVFYPGNICIIMAFFAFIQKKPYGFYVRGEKGILSHISKFLYRHAKIVLTISPKFTQTIKGFRANTTDTIRPMIECSEKDIIHDRQYEKKETNRLLYVGRLERRKGSYDIVLAVKRMIEIGSHKFSFDIVGDGPEASEVKKFVNELGLSEYIIFHGAITEKNELKKYYNQSDLFVYPSHDEGFPRVLYEAAIYGLPIATTFVGAISYLMKDNYNCFKLPEKNAKKMGDVLCDILKKYNIFHVIAKNATKTITDYLTINKTSHAQKLINEIRKQFIK